MALTGRTAVRRDGNERAIIEALEAVGANVSQHSAKGEWDLTVSFRQRTYLMEVKLEKGTLTTDQLKFHEKWKEDKIWIVRSVPEALNVIGAVSIVPLNENDGML